MGNQVIEERKKRLADLYQQALDKNLVINKKEFAALIGVTNTTLSAAMNGNERMLSESIVKKAERAVIGCAYAQPEEDNKKETAEDGDLVTLMRELVDCFNKERESHEKIVMGLIQAIKK